MPNCRGYPANFSNYPFTNLFSINAIFSNTQKTSLFIRFVKKIEYFLYILFNLSLQHLLKQSLPKIRSLFRILNNLITVTFLSNSTVSVQIWIPVNKLV
jgi:hypothetical protein